MDITEIFWLFIQDVLAQYPDEVLRDRSSYITIANTVSEDYSLLYNVNDFGLSQLSVLFDFMEISSPWYNSPYYNNPYLVFNNINDMIYFMKDFLNYIDHPRGEYVTRALDIILAWVDEDDLCTTMKSIGISHK